ncbi:MAG: hypothetical protein ABIF04_05430 [Chloroflexota bacterium]
MNKKFVPFGNTHAEFSTHPDGSLIDPAHGTGRITYVSYLHWNYKWIEYEGKKLIKENGNDVREVYKTTDIVALLEQFGFHGWELIHFDQRNCILKKPTGNAIPSQKWEYGKLRHGHFTNAAGEDHTFSFRLFTLTGESVSYYKNNCKENLLSSLFAQLGEEGWELISPKGIEEPDISDDVGFGRDSKHDYYFFKRSVLNYFDHEKYPYEAEFEAWRKNIQNDK